MVEIELTLVWAIIVTITLVVIVAFLIKLRRKYDQDISYKENKEYGIKNITKSKI